MEILCEDAVARGDAKNACFRPIRAAVREKMTKNCSNVKVSDSQLTVIYFCAYHDAFDVVTIDEG
jgi:hypothetical protein